MSAPPDIRQDSASLGTRIFCLYSILAVFNVGAWLWAIVVFRNQTFLLGTALLAYSFGLRHALDADHIAAIDNVTRKFMQESRRPLSVGFFFALGHSTVVVAASLVVYFATSAAERRIDAIKNFGGGVASSISAFFLIGIALVNVAILRNVWRAFQRAVKGELPVKEATQPFLLASPGSRILRPLFGLLSKPWHMYPIGVLFGLGFDTATEVALLGISAGAADKGLSMTALVIFPLLFTAAMILVDTTDGIVMLGAYQWAFINPVRKLYYNLVITFFSVLVAFLIGGIELTVLLKNQLNVNGGLWDIAAGLNENFGMLGIVIVAAFVLTWIGSVAFYQATNLDRRESARSSE